MNPVNWISPTISLVSALIAIVVAFTILRVKVDNLAMNEKHIKSHLENASRELSEAVKAITVFTHEQNIINKMTADTLSVLMRKIEVQEDRLNQESATVKLLVELVRRLEKVNG